MSKYKSNIYNFNNIKFTNNQHLKIKLVDSYLCSYEGDTL